MASAPHAITDLVRISLM